MLILFVLKANNSFGWRSSQKNGNNDAVGGTNLKFKYVAIIINTESQSHYPELFLKIYDQL